VVAPVGAAVSMGVAHPEADSYAAAKAKQLRKVAKAKQRTLKRLIVKDPPKAEKLIQHQIHKAHPEAPKVKVQVAGTQTKAVKAPRATVNISAADASKLYSPAKKVRKQVRQSVVKAAKKAPTLAPSRQERVEAKTELKAAAKKAKPGLLSKLDRKWAPGEQITPHQAAVLAEAQGLPGKTYAQIAVGESNLTPNIVGTDPGGTHGLGLWQMTPGVQSRETKKAWDAIAKQHPGGYKNPVAAAEMAKFIAGEGTGVGNYYGTGSVTDPDAHLPGGPAKAQKKLAGKPEPIPKKVKAQAKETLGTKKTKEIVKKAQGTTTASPEAKQLKGPLGGSRAMVREIVGSKVKGDHGTKNEGTIHSASGDHYGPGSYAQDINSPTGNPAEGEPPYNQATLDKMVANLRKLGADVPDLTIGENWEGNIKGYAVQLLTNEGGTVNHIHIGAHWEGTPTSAGSTSGYAASSIGSAVSGGTTASSAATQTGTATARGKSAKKRKAKKLEGRQRSQLLRKLIAQGPPTAESVVAPPSDYSTATRVAPVKVSL
jgi:hypothetical protein